MKFNNNPYGNYKMISMEGNFLAYTDLKKMNWYLERNLAEIVDDKIYKLNFETKGSNNERGDFYKIPLENICVVCGSNEELTRHHVVPSQYRKLLPLEYKGRNSYDIVSMCDTCHNNYEIEAEKLKSLLLVKYHLSNYINSSLKLKRAHAVLKLHSVNYTEERLEMLRATLINHYDDSLENILKLEKLKFEDISVKLMEKVKNIDDFIIMWRKHFLQFAKPKHINKKWIDDINITKII